MSWQPIGKAPCNQLVLAAWPPLSENHGWMLHVSRFKGRKGWCPAFGPSRQMATQPTHWMSLPEPPTGQ